MPHLQFILFVVIATAWLLWLPGGLLYRLLGLRSKSDLLVSLAIQLALGMAFWPLLFLWSSTAGFRWSAESARVIIGATGLIGCIAMLASSRSRWHHRYRLLRYTGGFLLAFIFLFAVTLWTRYLHIQSLILPAWVDSVHHTMVSNILMEQGYLPDTYDPYLPHGRFFYHWGFHLLVACVGWITGAKNAIDVARLLLIMGQFFNALNLLMLYAMGRVWFGSRRVGLWAAGLATLVSWFPAYYVSWGRYPHLVGMMVLPAASIILYRLLTTPTTSQAQARSSTHPIPNFFLSKNQTAHVVAATLLLSGLLLIHIRVAFFAFTLGSVFALLALVKRRWQDFIHLAYISLGSILLCLPWLLRLASNARLQEMVERSNTGNNQWWTQYNSIPWELVWIRGQDLLLALASGGITVFVRWPENTLWFQLLALVWATLLCGQLLWTIWIYMFHKQQNTHTISRFMRSLLILYSWPLITWMFINGNQIGLPVPRFVHNSSAVISLYLPLSLIVGALLVSVIELFAFYQTPSRRKVSLWFSVLGVSIAGLIGASSMRSVVNPTTALVDFGDVTAMQWIRNEIPVDAKFAVNSKPWLRKTHRGTDGGYWLTTLTGRESILPVGIYALALPQNERERVNASLQAWGTIDISKEQILYELMKSENITHIYLGAKGGQLNELPLNSYPFLAEIYHDGPIIIYKFIE